MSSSVWAWKSAHAVSEMFKGQLPFQANIEIVEIPALFVGDDDVFADAVEKRGFGTAQQALAGLDCVAGLPLVFGQKLDAHDGSCRVVGHGRTPSRRRASRCRHCFMSSMIRWPHT